MSLRFRDDSYVGITEILAIDHTTHSDGWQGRP